MNKSTLSLRSFILSSASILLKILLAFLGFYAAIFAIGIWYDQNVLDIPFVVIIAVSLTVLILSLGMILKSIKSLRSKLYSEIERDYLSRISEEDIREEFIVRKIQLRRAEMLRDRNLQSSFILKQVQFKNAGILGTVKWQPSPNINIMLGRNGYGKSYFLRLVIGLLSYDNDRLNYLVGGMNKNFDMRLDLLRDGEPITIKHDSISFDESTGKIPILAIPDTRFMNRDRNSVAADEGDYADLSRHGAHHFLYDKPFEATIQTVLAQMCIEIIGAKGDDVKYPESPQLELISKAIFKLSGENFVFQRIQAIGSGRFGITVETEASPGKPISIQQASQGTMSVIAIFGLIYQFLKQLRPDVAENKISDQYAIVLIDEVDAHLHPAWQRKIVTLLNRTFPNVQFILTAHSPLIVAGRSFGEISVLKRQNNVLKLVEHQEDFIGTSIDEIYEELFEIGSRDDTFLDYYAQLPLVQDLKEQLDIQRNSKNPDTNFIERTQERLNMIHKAQSIEIKDLDIEMLTRENEQLRRELNLDQKSTDKLS